VPDRPRWGTLDVDAEGTVWMAGLDDSLTDFIVAWSVDAEDDTEPPSFDSRVVDMAGTVAWFGGPNPDGLLGQVWIASDDSDGPTAGNLYVLATVDPAGSDPLDVHFIRSTDGGASWSLPARINTDPQGNYQWFGTMSVAPNGRIDVVWNDTRNTGEVNRSELFLSQSHDGGLTWTPNERISPEWDSFVGWPNQNKIGDYYDMISDRVGAHLAWAATFNGEQDVYYTRIGDYDCNDNGVADSADILFGDSDDLNGNGIPDECEEGVVSVPALAASSPRAAVASPNPARARVAFVFTLARGSEDVRVDTFDIEGRQVRTLFESHPEAGRHRVIWDGRDGRGRPVSQGTYVYRVHTGAETASGRVSVIR